MLVSSTDPRPYWFLLLTKAKQERKVMEGLEARQFEAYCPRVLDPHPRSWEPKGPVPLFPSYVFARLALAERLAAAQYCPGVAGLVRIGRGFAALEDTGIDALRAREEEKGYIVLAEPRKELRTGSRVRVVRGVLAGIEGVVSRYMPARQRVHLLLSLASGFRGAEVASDTVRCA